jgi:threonine dehydrogenase-like Zn-dependent dehydrogenase
MGHEFCGRISKIGAHSKLEVGQAVMIDPRLFCSDCHGCKTGDTNICKNWGFLGYNSDDGGGFSEYVAVDEKLCHVLPPAVPLAEAALIEPLAVARHALRKSGVDDFQGKTVLVLGGGPVGLAIVFVLKASGAGKIIVSEPTAKRREQNASLVDVVLNPREVRV